MKSRQLLILPFLIIILGFDFDPKDLVDLKETSFLNATTYQHKWNKSSTGGMPKATDVKNTLVLNSKEQSELKNIFEKGEIFTSGKSYSACFQPRHTILIEHTDYTFTVIKICFACHNFNVNGGPSQILNITDNNSLREFFESLNMGVS